MSKTQSDYDPQEQASEYFTDEEQPVLTSDDSFVRKRKRLTNPEDSAIVARKRAIKAASAAQTRPETNSQAQVETAPQANNAPHPNLIWAGQVGLGFMLILGSTISAVSLSQAWLMFIPLIYALATLFSNRRR